jgi:hypothetical protein
MKVSVLKNTHTGQQPIRVLKHNLTARLEERNKKYIESLQSDFRLNKNIKYISENLPINVGQKPKIDSNGIIHLHETFLSYVWIVCYYFFVLHEEKYAIPNCIKNNLPTPKPHNPELLPIAKELFDYGKSLVTLFSVWDKDNLPNPEYFDEQTDEGYYIFRTNDLHVEVLNFILYHEMAHAEFEHIKKRTIGNLTNEENKPFEIDADTRAIELILSNCRNRNVSELAIIIGIASMLFCNSTLDGGKRHPNIDTRLENAIGIFNLLDDSYNWTFLALFLLVWDEQFTLGLKKESTSNNCKEIFYDLLSQVKKCN